jgi:hypothetical protein
MCATKFHNNKAIDIVIGLCILIVRLVARMGEVRGAYNILVGRPEGRRPLGRPRRR